VIAELKKGIDVQNIDISLLDGAFAGAYIKAVKWGNNYGIYNKVG
jgi:hypothetical protein